MRLISHLMLTSFNSFYLLEPLLYRVNTDFLPLLVILTDVVSKEL